MDKIKLPRLNCSPSYVDLITYQIFRRSLGICNKRYRFVALVGVATGCLDLNRLLKRFSSREIQVS